MANPTTIPVVIKSATYLIAQSCAPAPSTGVVSCISNTVPPATQASGPGVITCSLSGPVPCSGSGSVQILVTAASGLQLSSVPVALKFLTPKGDEAAKTSCATVSAALAACADVAAYECKCGVWGEVEQHGVCASGSGSVQIRVTAASGLQLSSVPVALEQLCMYR